MWANGQLQITAVGKYNYRNDYTFDKLVVEVVWTRAAGAPLNVNGPTLNFTPEASLPTPPNFTLALPPLLPPAGYTDCIMKVRIIVTKPNTPDETDVHGVSVVIPPKPIKGE